MRKEHGVVRIADIAYDDKPAVDPGRQSLDIYMREGLTGVPVVLYVHDGSWVRGDKRRALFKPAKLVPEGYRFASMKYRFWREVSLSEMAQDFAIAASWLRRHAVKYGGDGSKNFLMGHLAGAYLVSVVASNEEFTAMAGASLGDLNGVVAIDTAMFDVPLQMENAGPAHVRAFGTDPDTSMPVSPWHHIEVGQGITPFLLFVSDGRPTMNEQVLPLKSKLHEAGVPASAFEAKGRAHSPLDTDLGVIACLGVLGGIEDAPPVNGLGDGIEG